MATKDVILSLRTKNGLSQDELAGKGFCDAAGGFPLGKRRNRAQSGHAEAPVRTV